MKIRTSGCPRWWGRHNQRPFSAGAVLAFALAVVLFPLPVTAQGDLAGTGPSINHGLCEDSSNRVLQHSTLLPVEVCFDEGSSVLHVRNIAPYWVRLQARGDALWFSSSDLSGTSAAEAAVATAIASASERQIPPGATFRYGVDRELLGEIRFLPDAEMAGLEFIYDSVQTMISALPGTEPGQLIELGFQDKMKLAYLSLETGRGLRSEGDIALELARLGLDTVPAGPLTQQLLVTIPNLAAQLLENMDHANALSTYTGTTLIVHPLDDPPPVLTKQCDGRPATIEARPGVPTEGTAGDDVIVGTAGRDVIRGAAGNDLICGAGGDDDIRGDHGHDEIHGDGGHDTIRGGHGNDTVHAASGNDRVWGDDGNDSIWGGSGNDSLDGGAGNDRLDGAAGSDTLAGHSGTDRCLNGETYVSCEGGDAPVQRCAGRVATIVASPGTPTDGTSGSDVIVGTAGRDIIRGHNGNDLICGGGGNDEILGDSGNDRIYGGSGHDLLKGGYGIDRIYGQDGNDTLRGEWGSDHVDGGRHNDQLWGDSGHDVIHGQTGHDQIRGGSGNDTIYGASGNDRVWGHDGNDRIWGGSGDDNLDGDAGNDRIDGSSGRDTVRGDQGTDSCYNREAGDYCEGGLKHNSIVELTNTGRRVNPSFLAWRGQLYHIGSGADYWDCHAQTGGSIRKLSDTYAKSRGWRLHWASHIDRCW